MHLINKFNVRPISRGGDAFRLKCASIAITDEPCRTDYLKLHRRARWALTALTNYEINFHIFSFSSCVLHVSVFGVNVERPVAINNKFFSFRFVRLTSDPTIFLQFS